MCSLVDRPYKPYKEVTRMTERQLLESGGSGGRSGFRFDLRSFLGLLLVFLCFNVGIHAYVTAAHFVAPVTDSAGGILPNVPVSIQSLETNAVHTAKSSSAGEYTFTLL